MVLFWPFGGSGRIMDLKAPELAQAAIKSIQKTGRTAYSLRLIYRALDLDPFQAHALLVLSELFRGKNQGARPVGDEIFAGILLEYAMDPKSTIPANQKVLFDRSRMEIMKSWGFVGSRGTDADVDHLGYMGYINELMGKVRSVTNGFAIAHQKLGVQSGALDPVKFKPTRPYLDWLRSEATTLRS